MSLSAIEQKSGAVDECPGQIFSGLFRCGDRAEVLDRATQLFRRWLSAERGKINRFDQLLVRRSRRDRFRNNAIRMSDRISDRRAVDHVQRLPQTNVTRAFAFTG